MEGHIHKRVRVDGAGKSHVLWYVILELERGVNGRRRQKWHGGFATRKDAEAARAKLVNEINTGLYLPSNGATLGAWIEDNWLPMMSTQVKSSTWSSYSANMKRHVLPAIGGVKFKSLTAGHLDKLYAALGNGSSATGAHLSPKTIRYIHTTLHKCLSDAVAAGMMQSNPADRSHPPKPKASQNTEIKVWTPPQLSAFLNAARHDRLYAAFHLLAMTGMRRGEVLGLRWDDIDVAKARLAIRRGLISVNYNLEFSTPKTHQARVVDLDPTTLAHLATHRDNQASEKTAWGAGYLHSDQVFTREDGSLVHPESLSDRFEVLQHRIDLPVLRLHDLRHTHASIALSIGIPVKVISERLGHETPAFTLKQYAHVLPGMQAEAAVLVASLITSKIQEKPA